VNTNQASKNAGKPYLVEGGRDGKNIFRVVEANSNAPQWQRWQIEKLLQNLPIGFELRKDLSPNAERLNEPLEVHVSGMIVRVYPPRHRVVACTTFDSWNSAPVVSKMHVDNVMDTTCPGNGQLRTCVHFDPAILGIEGLTASSDTEIEVDVHVFPLEEERAPKLKPLSFGKRDVEKLLKLISGSDGRLTVDQVREWRELITYAVKSMRAFYETPDRAEDDSVRLYYRSCWEEIEAAGNNGEKLASALEGLRSSIEWE